MRDIGALMRYGRHAMRKLPDLAVKTESSCHLAWSESHGKNWILLRPRPSRVGVEYLQYYQPVRRELFFITYLEETEGGARPERAPRKDNEGKMLRRFSIAYERKNGEEFGHLTYWDADGALFRPSGAGIPFTKRELRTLSRLLNRAKESLK